MNIINNEHDHRSDYTQLRGLVDMLLDLPLWVRCGTIIEIGAYTGDSTQILSLCFDRVITVDPVGNTPDFAGLDSNGIYKKLTEKIKKLNIEHVRACSQDTFTILPKCNAVYIDGNHSYEQVISDIKNYWPLIVNDGYLCGHDYCNPLTEGVTRAVKEVFGEPDNYYIDWSWSIKKTDRRLHDTN